MQLEQQILSFFVTVGKSDSEITRTVYYEGEEENVFCLRRLTRHLVENWEKLQEHYLLQKLDWAIKLKRAEIGINKVCKATKRKRGKLLIVERNFSYPFEVTNYNEIVSLPKVSAIPDKGGDSVEDVIERVLAAGGELEFVDPGRLRNYMHIALIV